jgi:hypothetical protein
LAGLVRASYESVNWTVTNAGAQIAVVLLSGDEPSRVTGIGAAPRHWCCEPSQVV